jgi:hypothetical protein
MQHSLDRRSGILDVPMPSLAFRDFSGLDLFLFGAASGVGGALPVLFGRAAVRFGLLRRNWCD